MSIIVKSKAKKTSLLAEGNYLAAVHSVKGDPDDVKPKRIKLGFKIAGHEPEVEKLIPASFEKDSVTVKDTETILGRSLNRTEIEEGFDLQTLVGKSCNVMVMHKPAAGGRPLAVVSVVLPPTQAQLPAA